MLLDAQNLMSDKQSVVLGSGSTVLSTNTIDLGAAGTPPQGGPIIYDVGRGDAHLQLLVQVTTTVVGAGASLEAQLVCADDAALGTNLTVVATSGPVAIANLVAGYQFRFGSLPPGITRRFLGMKYIDTTAAITAGNVTAALVDGKQTSPSVG